MGNRKQKLPVEIFASWAASCGKSCVQVLFLLNSFLETSISFLILGNIKYKNIGLNFCHFKANQHLGEARYVISLDQLLSNICNNLGMFNKP